MKWLRRRVFRRVMRELVCEVEKSKMFPRSHPRGDSIFLQFIHDRLLNIHGEREITDYMWRLRLIIATLERVEEECK